MGHISTILVAILCASSPIAAAEALLNTQEQTISSIQSGKERVATVREAFKDGAYNEFLSEMDSSYKQADVDNFIQTRKKTIPKDFSAKWEDKFSSLQKTRNEELLTLISDTEDSPFADKVRTLASEVSTPAQEKAISKLNSFILMAPKTGANDDENKLIDIDVEYEYKLFNAQMPLSDVSPAKMEEYSLALRMEKMQKMQAAAKDFKDHDLKQAVGLAAANLDQRLARNLDGAELNTLARTKATSELEEKVYSVITSYQGQFSDLMKDIDHANR